MDKNAENLNVLKKISTLTGLRSKIDFDGYTASQEEIDSVLKQLPNQELKQIGSDLITYTIKVNELHQKREVEIANNATQLKSDGIIVIGSNHVRNIKKDIKKKH